MNTTAIGNYIASLRKKRGWTQRQLAKQLNVTHQAVSKWEKGATMPDIETLLAMSKLFGVTVDMIISATTESVNNESNTSKLDDGNNQTPEMEQLKKEKIESHMKYVIKNDYNNDDDSGDRGDNNVNVHVVIDTDDDGLDPSISKIVYLAPFISKDVLDKKFMTLIEEKENLQSGIIMRLAPFLSKDVLKVSIDKIAEGDVDPKLIQYVAPFIDKQDLADLVRKMQDTEWISDNLVGLAPFLPKDFLDEIFMNEI